MRDIRKLEKCNGPVKGLITSCKSEQLWQAMSGRVNGKGQYCQLWELLLKRINSLFLIFPLYEFSEDSCGSPHSHPSNLFIFNRLQNLSCKRIKSFVRFASNGT